MAASQKGVLSALCTVSIIVCLCFICVVNLHDLPKVLSLCSAYIYFCSHPNSNWSSASGNVLTCVHFYRENSNFTCCVVVIVFKFTLVEIMIVCSCSPIFLLTLIMTVGQMKASSMSLSIDVNGH